MRTDIDSSELDRLTQIVEHLGRRPAGSITDTDNGQLSHIQAVTRRVVDNEDLDDAISTRAALLYGRATEVKVDAIMAAARAITPHLCRSCTKGHRVPCERCTCDEPAVVLVPGNLRRSASS